MFRRTLAAIFSTDHGSDLRRIEVRMKIDLATAMAAVTEQPARELTLYELIRAFSVAKCDGSDTRLRKWTDAFGSVSAWAISAEQLETAAQAMREHGYKPSSVNRDLSALGSAYRWAKDKRLSPRGFKSPTLGVKRFDEGVRRVHVEREDLEALRARSLAFQDRRFGAFVALLIDTGARKSELLQRRWADVDLERREIIAPVTKNGTPRVLFFSAQTEHLMRRVFVTRDPSALLFEGRVPGQPISFRKAWDTVTSEVGLPDFHMHDVRHAAAAALLRAGVTLGVAAQVLGHDPAVLARRYGHLETGALRAAQEQVWRAA
jgi:integrase